MNKYTLCILAFSVIATSRTYSSHQCPSSAYSQNISAFQSKQPRISTEQPTSDQQFSLSTQPQKKDLAYYFFGGISSTQNDMEIKAIANQLYQEPMPKIISANFFECLLSKKCDQENYKTQYLFQAILQYPDLLEQPLISNSPEPLVSFLINNGRLNIVLACTALKLKICIPEMMAKRTHSGTIHYKSTVSSLMHHLCMPKSQFNPKEAVTLLRIWHDNISSLFSSLDETKYLELKEQYPTLFNLDIDQTLTEALKEFVSTHRSVYPQSAKH